MKTPTFATLSVLIATAVAHPATNGLWPRACAPGTLVCNGDAKFGICNIDRKAVWMSVSDGTKCICSGSVCSITATSGGNSGNTQAPIPSPTPDVKPLENNPQIVPIHSPKSKQSDSYPIPPTSTVVEVNYPTTSLVVAPTPTPVVLTTTTPVAAPTTQPTTSPSPGSGPPPSGGPGYIKNFLGNGNPSQGWPQDSQWADFDSMWSLNLANVISKSCTTFSQDNNSEQESADLKKAIQSVAKSSGVDERFILAIVMQESGGCVRAPTTNYGVTNPGLMQSHNGAHSCFNKSPCPSTEIVGMIQDGTTGTSSGDGLQQIIAKAGSGVSQFYKAARIYNSGSIAATGLLQDGIATHCYASDIANRLIGWSDGPSSCKLS